MNKEVMLNLIVKFYFAHYEVIWKEKLTENNDLKKKNSLVSLKYSAPKHFITIVTAFVTLSLQLS